MFLCYTKGENYKLEEAAVKVNANLKNGDLLCGPGENTINLHSAAEKIKMPKFSIRGFLGCSETALELRLPILSIMSVIGSS